MICPGCGCEFKGRGQKYCSRPCAIRSQPRYRKQAIRMPMAETDLAYLAGILDGEGYISRRFQRSGERRPTFIVGITNTDMGLMEWLLGMGGTLHRKKRGAGKQCYEWNVRSLRDAVAFLRAVEPYMRIKQEAARSVIAEADAIFTVLHG